MRRRTPYATHGNELLGLFADAADNAASAAELLEETLKRWPSAPELPEAIRAREHEGDRITHDVLSKLQRTFVLPFDREDGHRLASAIDDVVDYIDEAAEHLVI